jgi:transposase
LVVEVMIMARYIVTLEKEERDGLLAMVGKGKGDARAIRRANILLAVDRGEFADLRMSDDAAAASYRTSSRTVYSVKQRFVEEGLATAIGRKEGSGSALRRKIDGEVEAKIVAITCTNPPVGHASWTLRLLADKVVELGILESVSHVAVGEVLKKTNLSHGYIGSGASRSAPAST